MTGTLAGLHSWWAWVAVVGNGLAGAWALAASRWDGLRFPALWWFTGMAQVAMFLQVVLGVALVSGQDREAPQFHLFYGFLTLVAIAIVYSYRSQLRHRIHLLYGLGGLFIMGLGIRAMVLPA